MERLKQKREGLKRRIRSVRFKIKSRHPRPRLVVKRTNNYIWTQIIDDEKGITLCSATTKKLDLAGNKKNKKAAEKLGEEIAGIALEKGIKKVVMDRRGRLYHGRIAAFAGAVRKKGLEF